jgi:hypothetical protein
LPDPEEPEVSILAKCAASASHYARAVAPLGSLGPLTLSPSLSTLRQPQPGLSVHKDSLRDRPKHSRSNCEMVPKTVERKLVWVRLPLLAPGF